MKILCTGDLHIGRRSSQLPADAPPAESSAAAAWARIVDLALREEVDVVALSGDVIDQANQFFEAIGALESGLRTLSNAGVEVVLVSGNHDHDILPRAVDSVGAPNVHLLGRGGVWERRTIERGGVRLHLDGWSFPAGRYEASPLATYALPSDGTPVLAILHGDLDQSRSIYAPIVRAELRRHPHVLFLLGHIHARSAINEANGARAFYPGSPQALDPGEPGSHGVEILEYGSGGFEARFVPVSSVRYEMVPVDISGMERREEVDVAIARAVTAVLEEAVTHDGALRQLRCRIRLMGETVLHSELDREVERRAGALELTRGAGRATVGRVEVATRPRRDLREIEAGKGVAAVVARLLVELESGESGPLADRVLADALLKAREVETARVYQAVLEAEPVPDGVRREEAREMSVRAASVLLDRLLAQKEVTA